MPPPPPVIGAPFNCNVPPFTASNCLVFNDVSIKLIDDVKRVPVLNDLVFNELKYPVVPRPITVDVSDCAKFVVLTRFARFAVLTKFARFAVLTKFARFAVLTKFLKSTPLTLLT